MTDTPHPYLTPYEPPPYPYDLLDEVRAVARERFGGAIDCSIGAPIDPPPASENMQGSGNPAAAGTMLLKDNHPLVTMPDGSVVGAFSAGPPGAVWLYGSENHGMTWQCLSRIAVDDAGVGRPTCAPPQPPPFSPSPFPPASLC